jgi:alpha-ketoglutarate-dependent taurine dioxygenase
MAVVQLVRGNADWRADRVAAWAVTLDDVQRAELLDPPDGPALPALDPLLRAQAEELRQGRGFVVFQGVPVDGLTESQRVSVATRLLGRLGTVLPQGDLGHVVHVQDDGSDPANGTTKSYQHNKQLGFHADPTDAVALLCLRAARSGGLSTIVSSVAVHNELVRTRPDLARLLYEPWWFDRRTGDGPDSFYRQPVYTVDGDGALRTRYGPDYMLSAQRGAHVPPLTPLQHEALAAMDALHRDPRFVLSMDLRPGDLQVLNNHVILHSRTAYEDDPHSPRHLLRFWLGWA